MCEKNKTTTLGFRTCSLCELLGECGYQRDTCPYLGRSGQSVREINVNALLDDIDFADSDIWETYSCKCLPEDDDTVLFAYYVRFINDCLREIRSCGAAFVYKIEHIKDILRFEPDIRVRYGDDVYYVEFMRNEKAATMRRKALIKRSA